MARKKLLERLSPSEMRPYCEYTECGDIKSIRIPTWYFLIAWKPKEREWLFFLDKMEFDRYEPLDHYELLMFKVNDLHMAGALTILASLYKLSRLLILQPDGGSDPKLAYGTFRLLSLLLNFNFHEESLIKVKLDQLKSR